MVPNAFRYATCRWHCAVTRSRRLVVISRWMSTTTVKGDIHSAAAPQLYSGQRPRVIFSGIQPTGVPHLGNYLGALQQWVKLQNEAGPSSKLFFSVVDLHAITMPQDPQALAESRKSTFATLLAVGLDPDISTIFYQSAVPQHAELMWLLSCRASTGYLSRMTQWKSKLSLSDDTDALDEDAKERLKLGLFSYPVLQAADILVHRATHVPVGEDQSQHLEFARTMAKSFNSKHHQVLVPPITMVAPVKRVMALNNPTTKMSKSDVNPKSRIDLTDSPEAISRKVRFAISDSDNRVTYEPQARPGVSNLVELAFHLDAAGYSTPAERAVEFKDLSMLAFKERVSQIICEKLQPIRERYLELMSPTTSAALEAASRQGAAKARLSAEATMVRVREALGLL